MQRYPEGVDLDLQKHRGVERKRKSVCGGAVETEVWRPDGRTGVWMSGRKGLRPAGKMCPWPNTSGVIPSFWVTPSPKPNSL